MSYLLDTNVLGEIRKPRPHPAVAAWYEEAGDDELFLSVLVVGEIQQGVARLRRKDPRQAAVYETWLGKLRREFADRVLPVTQDVALEWGRVSAENPPPVIDGLIAATALVHGLTVVTRNVADFEPTGVPLLDPFAPRPPPPLRAAAAPSGAGRRRASRPRRGGRERPRGRRRPS